MFSLSTTLSRVLLSGAVLVTISACTPTSPTTGNVNSTVAKTVPVAMEKKEPVAMEKKDPPAMEKPAEPAMMAKGAYLEYDPSGTQLALAKTGKVVLFFHAAWCPSCKGADADITANLDAIPANVTLLKVDYDKYTDLKNKYGVTYQHTFVVVDENGTELNKWNGGATLADILAKL